MKTKVKLIFYYYKRSKTVSLKVLTYLFFVENIQKKQYKFNCDERLILKRRCRFTQIKQIVAF